MRPPIEIRSVFNGRQGLPAGAEWWLLIAELVAIGATAGILGGMLGVGGGIVMITAMTIIMGERFGSNSFHLYKLASITTTCVLSLPAIVQHWRAGAILSGHLRAIVPGALLGVIFGVALSSLFVQSETVYLRRGFGVFLECVVLFNLYQWYAGLNEERGAVSRCPLPSRGLAIASTVGLPMGVIAGLLGVGGGVWAVPAMRLGFGVRIRNAIANSACAILPVSIATSLVHALSVSQRTELRLVDAYTLAGFLAPSALLMAWIGASLTHRVPVKTLRQAFQVLLAVAGLRLMFS